MTAELISDAAFDAALACGGRRAPAAAAGRSAARAAFSQVVFKIARRLLDAVSVVSSTRTLQPEHFHDLAKVAALLSATLAAEAPPQGRGVRRADRRGMVLMRGGVGMPGVYFDPASDDGYVASGGSGMPGVYFDPASGDGGRYAAENVASFTPSFAEGTVRLAIGGAMGGGGQGTRWLTDEAIAAILREYKARSAGTPARVSEAAKGLIRVIVETNAAAVLAGIGGKCSASAISKEAAKQVLHI